jgi:hypothetical protein
VLKLVVLLVFPLVVFNLVSPYLQGLPDLVGRTVVVRRVVGDGTGAKRS